MSPEPTRAQIVATIDHHIARKGATYAAVSRMIGKNEAYLQQFAKRGTPERLPEDVRLLLARFFNIDERELGAREPWVPGGD